MRLRLAALSAAVFLCSQVSVFQPRMLAAPSPGVVISQVYGGGGNSGAPYTHDFVELFNRGGMPVSIAGWSIQYTSATGTGNFGASATLISELPAITLQPGQYVLVQEASQAAVGSPLPTPDVVDTTPIAMAAGAGKVALVNTIMPLGCNGNPTVCSPAALATIVDLVGDGTANFFEGTAAAPALTNTTAAFRDESGCSDTDENAVDFASAIVPVSPAPPAPRNTSSAPHPCSGPPAISIDDVTVNEGNSGTVTATFTVSLSAPAGPGGVFFDISTADATATVADGDYGAATLVGETIAEGSTTYSFDVTVFGDITVEANETFLVNVTNATGAIIGDGQGTGTISNDDFVTPVFSVVISQVYGGGGNAGATLKNDFIELFNCGSTSVNLSGWSLQYMSATGSGTWSVTPLSGSIAPGALLSRAAGGRRGWDRRSARARCGRHDCDGRRRRQGAVLVTNVAAVTGSCAAGTTVVDLVGYGTANCFEGTAPTNRDLATRSPRCASAAAASTRTTTASTSRSAHQLPRNAAAPARAAHSRRRRFMTSRAADSQTPLLGQDVTTTGIVTGRKTNGFFIQAPDADADGNPATSEGLFVFTSTAPAVTAGDVVTVKGTATEFFNLTQLESRCPATSSSIRPATRCRLPVVLTTAILDPGGAARPARDDSKACACTRAALVLGGADERASARRSPC